MKNKTYYIYNKEDLLGLLIREDNNYKFFRNDKVDINLVPTELVSSEELVNANQFVDSRRIARVDNSGIIEDLIEDTSLVNIDDHIWVKTESMKSFSQHPRYKEGKSITLNLDSIEDESRLLDLYNLYNTKVGRDIVESKDIIYSFYKTFEGIKPINLEILNQALKPISVLSKELEKSFSIYKTVLAESMEQLNKSYTFTFSDTILNKCFTKELEENNESEVNILLSELLEEYDKEV